MSTRLNIDMRLKIIDLSTAGNSVRQIAEQLNTPKSTVQNVLTLFTRTGSVLRQKIPGAPRSKCLPDVVEFVEFLKFKKASITASEIRAELLRESICTEETLPACRTIYEILRRDLNYSYKKIQSIPAEQLTERNLQRIMLYIDAVTQLDPLSVHFFDEAGIKRTTANRQYGHSSIGQRAFEVQRYTSDVNFTLNLLHCARGVSYFSILDGPSNGLEMVHFFEEALEMVDDQGQQILSPGDTVVWTTVVSPRALCRDKLAPTTE
ncbi:paired box protein 1 homolog [Ptychodera flava]|uniref:paired box protein 1 homolog n=1 Tax=Ptychodera flava TaxID=63121 RepID=UPI00396A59AD